MGWLRTTEAARRLGLSREKTCLLARRQRLTAIRRPCRYSRLGEWWFDEASIASYKLLARWANQWTSAADQEPDGDVVAHPPPAFLAVGQRWEFRGWHAPVPRGDYLVTGLDRVRVYLTRTDVPERPRWCVPFSSWQSKQWRRLDVPAAAASEERPAT